MFFLTRSRSLTQVLAEALGWIAEAVPEFGLGACDVKAIIEWMKADLGSPNAPGQWHDALLLCSGVVSGETGCSCCAKGCL